MSQPFTAWFTGVPGAGKTTLARLLTEQLRRQGASCAMLDGDDIRNRTRGALGFTPSARKVHVVYCAVAAAILNEAGVCAAAAFVSPSRDVRAQAREIVGERFFEIYVKCDFELAASRSHNPNWTGIHVPYEESEQPDLIVDTTKDSPEESLAVVMAMLQERGS